MTRFARTSAAALRPGAGVTGGKVGQDPPYASPRAGDMTATLPLCRPAGWVALWRRMGKVSDLQAEAG